jgi:ectoine hydroxylase-related dioxygenase (phytanoyl-CoA dioxygenase family)
MKVSNTERKLLDDVGYVLLPGLMDAEFLSTLRRETEAIFAREGDAAGSEFKQEAGSRRLANLVDKGAVFREVIGNPVVLSLVAQVLGSDYKLSSLNARSVNPLSPDAQPLHADMGAIPDASGYWVCNSIWLLDDFTSENGAPRVIPGSHRFGLLPQDALEDPACGHPDEVILTGAAGDVIVINSHIWHGGMGNHTDCPRNALHAFYARRDKPQQQYQKALLRPSTQALLSTELRDLLALDDPLNDEMSSRDHRLSGFMK